MSEDLNTEIAALDQALHHIDRAAEALQARDELHFRRLGVYSHARLGRGDLALTALRIRNERDRLCKHRDASKPVTVQTGVATDG